MYHHPPFRFPLGKYILIWLVILSFGQSFLKTIDTDGEASVRVKSVPAKTIHAGDKIVVGAHRYSINEVHVSPEEVEVVYKRNGRFETEYYKRMHRVKIIRSR